MMIEFKLIYRQKFTKNWKYFCYKTNIIKVKNFQVKNTNNLFYF